MHASVYTPPLAPNANTKSLGTQKAPCVAFLEQMGLNWAMKLSFIFIHQPSFLALNIRMLNFLPKHSPIISIGVIEAFVRRVRLREGVTSQRSTTGDVEGLISPSLPKRASHTLPWGHPTTSISIWNTPKRGLTIQYVGVEEGYNGSQQQSVKNQRR